MKKILAILLAMTMVLGMGANAFADWKENETFVATTTYNKNLEGNTVTFELPLSSIKVASATPTGTGDKLIAFNHVLKSGVTVDTSNVKDVEGNAVFESGFGLNISPNRVTLTLTLSNAVRGADLRNVVGDVTAAFTDPVVTYYEGTTAVNCNTTLVWTIQLDEIDVTRPNLVNTLDGNDAKAITGFAEDNGVAEEVKMTGTRAAPVSVDGVDTNKDYVRVDTGKLIPIDENDIRFYLRADMFAGSGYEPPEGDVYLGQTAVRENRMSARIQTAKGSALIKAGPTIKYDGGRAYIDIDFLDELTSVDDEGFEFTLALSIDGKRMDRNGEAAIVVGSLENIHEDVFADDEDFYLDEQDVIVAQDFNEDIELYLGAGVSVFTKLYKNKEYYGIAKRNDDEADDVVMAAHPDIDNVIRIYSVGLSSTGDVVGFSTDYDQYYVYDEGLNLLGMSDERVPFRSVYYLANRPLDVDVDVEPIDPPVDSDFAPPAGTGGDKAPTNANANPGTGF